MSRFANVPKGRNEAARLDSADADTRENLLRIVRESRPPRETWREKDRRIEEEIRANDPFQIHARIAKALGSPADTQRDPAGHPEHAQKHRD